MDMHDLGDSDDPLERLTIDIDGEECRIFVPGNLPLSAEADFVRRLSEVEAKSVTIDCVELMVCPSLIISALINLAKRMDRVSLVGVQPDFGGTLDLMHISPMFEIERASEL